MQGDRGVTDQPNTRVNECAVIDLHDEVVILSVLEQDRYWAAFALCDLDEPYRRHARYIGLVSGSSCTALVLVYSPPGLSVLNPFGELDGVRAILGHASGLPPSALLMARAMDEPAVTARYRFQERTRTLRMAVTPDQLAPPPERPRAVPLTVDDAAAIGELYGFWPGMVFRPEMLTGSIMRGIYDGGRLVAVARTHAFSARQGIGVIGGVFTHPAYRSRRFGTAVTSAVAQALRAAGARDILLNVHADNAPAIAAYRRLGFTMRLEFHEGMARLRST